MEKKCRGCSSTTDLTVNAINGYYYQYCVFCKSYWIIDIPFYIPKQQYSKYLESKEKNEM